ncbi:MAG: FKBP-type peptidyl-prolyl cis-trans isomerase [Proteobacteria bacterium]|nr:FKBP-type peptidyl-prolyl cis-trans isomerase [Pseudomonadota bacterium]
MKVGRMTVVFGLLLVANTVLASETLDLKTPKEKVSYAIGMDIGNSLKKNGVDINPDVLAKAIKDVLTGQKTQITNQEAVTVLTGLQEEMQEKRQESTKVLGEKNKSEGATFLAENMKKEGVKTLPSGLQYKVITEGKGKSPSATDTVTVQYTGRLVDGTEFDSSYKRGEAATFAVNGVVKGWTEALQLMKEGSKWQIFLPSNLAYGETGTVGGPIGPNAVLIFDVELVSLQSK